jgi:glycosyltransferase involved in cell wall biosynthesis
MDKMPKDQLVHALRYCDITLSLVPPRDYYKISSPTKMYESLVLGIPVIANREIHEQRKVIEQSGGGILCDYNTNSLKEAIGSLFSKKEDLKEMGIAGKEYILKHYEYRILAEKVRSYFK